MKVKYVSFCFDTVIATVLLVEITIQPLELGRLSTSAHEQTVSTQTNIVGGTSANGMAAKRWNGKNVWVCNYMVRLFFLLLILIFRHTWTTVSSLNSAKGAMLRIGTRKRDARHVRVWKKLKKKHGHFKIQVNGVGPKAVATDPSPNKTMGLLRNHTVMDRRMSRHTFGEICTTPQIAILNKKTTQLPRVSGI